MIPIRDYVYSELKDEDFINLDAMSHGGKFYEWEEWVVRMDSVQLTRLLMLAVVENKMVKTSDGELKSYYRVTDLGNDMIDWWVEDKKNEEFEN